MGKNFCDISGSSSAEEKWLYDVGQHELGHLCRSLRLLNPYCIDSTDWLLWNDQCRINVPILLQSSLYLHQFCQAHQKKRVLFTSRDCCHWIRVFHQLFPEMDSIYFHASRHTYRNPTRSYIEYVKDLYTNDTVIVDSHGTGASCRVFFRSNLGVEPTYLAIVSQEEKAPSILHVKNGGLPIEMLNYDTCGILLDVQEGRALRDQPEYPLEYVRPMHACIETCLELLPFYFIKTFDKEVIEWAVAAMQSKLAISEHIVPQVTSLNLIPVSSFDLFDTLLGRFHYRPDSIYALVEQLYPFAGFRFYRMAAECKSDRTLPDIYREFQKLTGMTQTEAAALMQFEFETEKKHIFPIIENLALVKEGDLIVSDTYYNTQQIQEILDVLGLDRKVQIFASARGKSSGHGWVFLKKNYKIESHLGDCFHSDVAMANLQNIEAVHYTNGRLSEKEERLLQLGHASLSYLCRALRLSNPHIMNACEWHAWNHQCSPRNISTDCLSGACKKKYVEFLPFYDIQPLDRSVIEALTDKEESQLTSSQEKRVEWVNRDQSFSQEPFSMERREQEAGAEKGEQYLLDLGHLELGALCKAVRLANPYVANEPEWFLWNDQCRLNVPILVQASLCLHAYCQKSNKRRILFTSRDCCLWIQVFRQLFPQYDSIYFHASRYTYRFASPSYIGYVKSLYTAESVIVDVQGTGLTCENFFREHMKSKPTYLAIISSEAHAMLQQHSIFFEGIEMLNYDMCGTLYDVQDHKALRCDPEYPLKYIVPMHKCLEKCLELLPRFQVSSGPSHKFLPFGLRESPRIEIDREGGSIEAIHPPSLSTQSRELSRESEWKEFMGRTTGFDLAVIEQAVKAMESDLAISRYIVHAKTHCHIADGAGVQHLHIARPKLLL